MKHLYTGINIQFPISQLILSREKTVETRTYRMPDKFLNQDMVMIETPGPTGKFKSRIVAIIRFEESFQYKSGKDFYRDIDRHKVTEDSAWAYDPNKGKWGWPVKVLKRFKEPIPLVKRIGIRFTREICI